MKPLYGHQAGAKVGYNPRIKPFLFEVIATGAMIPVWANQKGD